jgi:hypothetical protein
MRKNVESASWAERFVTRVGHAARKARGSQSARWLSEELEKFGIQMAPNVISKLDSGHRGANLHVHELIAIAAVLRIPPVQLLFDRLPDGAVEIWPGVQVPQHQALAWFCGERLDAFPVGSGGPVWRESVDRLSLVRRYAQLLDVEEESDLLALMARLAPGSYSDSERERLQDTATKARDTLRRLADELRELGMSVAVGADSDEG